MTKPTPPEDPPILRYGALSVPVVALCSGAALGLDHGVGTAVGSGVVLLNFWVLSVLGPRVVASLAREEIPTFWVMALVAKFVVLIGLFFLLFQILPPFGLLLGFVPVMLGTLAAGVHHGLQEAAAERAAASEER